MGNYTLGLEENLGAGADAAAYGFDTVALGLSPAIGGPSMQSQTVAGLATYDYYLGMFGLGQQPTNFTNLTESHPSFLATLKNKNLIPSLSWSYTAGAPYRKSCLFC